MAEDEDDSEWGTGHLTRFVLHSVEEWHAEGAGLIDLEDEDQEDEDEDEEVECSQVRASRMERPEPPQSVVGMEAPNGSFASAKSEWRRENQNADLAKRIVDTDVVEIGGVSKRMTQMPQQSAGDTMAVWGEPDGTARKGENVNADAPIRRAADVEPTPLSPRTTKDWNDENLSLAIGISESLSVSNVDWPTSTVQATPPYKRTPLAALDENDARAHSLAGSRSGSASACTAKRKAVDVFMAHGAAATSTTIPSTVSNSSKKPSNAVRTNYLPEDHELVKKLRISLSKGPHVTTTFKAHGKDHRKQEFWFTKVEPNTSFDPVKGPCESHRCREPGCDTELVVLEFLKFDEQNMKWDICRRQYKNIPQHYSKKHQKQSKEYDEELAQMELALEESKKSAAEKEADTFKQVAKMAVNPVSLEVLAKQKSADQEASLAPASTLSQDETRALHCLFAYAVAVDGLPQSAGEERGMQTFFRGAGIQMAFDHRTVARYQKHLVRVDWEEKRLMLREELKFSPQRMSLSLGVWSRDGTQLVGGMVTFVHALTVESSQLILGLEEIHGSPSSEAIAVCGEDLLRRAHLTKADLYSCTNDNASVTKATSGLLCSHVQSCFSHLIKLCVDDQLTIPDSKSSADETFGNEEAIEVEDASTRSSSNASKKQKRERFPELARVIKSAAAFATHYHQSPLCQAQFEAFLEGRKISLRVTPVTYASTRWTGLYTCLVRHLRSTTGCCLQEFLSMYNPTKVSPQVLSWMKPKAGDEERLKHVISILHPLHALNKRIEESTISLADAYVACLEALGELTASKIKVSDGTSFKVAKIVTHGGVDVHMYETFEAGKLDEEMYEFRKGLAESLSSRILRGQLEDEVLVNLFLDPMARSRAKGLTLQSQTKDLAETLVRSFNAMGERVESRMLKFHCDRLSGNRDTVVDTQAKALSAELFMDESLDLDALTPADKAALFRARSYAATTTTAPTSGMDGTISAISHEFAQLSKALLDAETEGMSDSAFWKAKRENFPNAYHVYICVRCIRPSSARLESVFSTASWQCPSESSSMSNDVLSTKLLLKYADLSMEKIRAASKVLVLQQEEEDKQGTRLVE